MYLFAASSGLYSCPLAMTDGAAKTIEVLYMPNINPLQLHKSNVLMLLILPTHCKENV